MLGILKNVLNARPVERLAGLALRRPAMASRVGIMRWTVLWERLVTVFKRSRLLKLAATVAAWFLVSLVLGAANWYFDEARHPLMVYIYNAFTVFSNLNDDLGLVITKGEGVGGYSVNIPAMCISVALIIMGMMGIALLTATLTSGSLNTDEEQFDREIDEFRALAVKATARPEPEREPADAHRILRMIIARIHGNIMPYRSRTTLHQINIYEFEYLLVNVINRIIENRQLLSDPPRCFLPYDLERITEIIKWFDSLDYLYQYLSDPSPSPVNDSFKRAWANFSVELVAKIRAAGAMKSAA